MDDIVGRNYDAATDLRDRYGDILDRASELIESSLRVPSTITDDETAGKVGDYIKQVMACNKNAEAARVKEKEPHLAAGRSVDAWFKKITDNLEATKKNVERRLTTYLREKEAKERAAREEAARLAAKQAAEAEAAMRSQTDLEDAITAQADADKAKKEAEAKAADLSRNRGDMGSVSSLRTFWDFADMDRDALDLEALRAHIPQDALDKAVRSFVKAGGRQLRGVRIYQNTQAAVR